MLGEMILGEKVRCGLNSVLVALLLDPVDDVPPLLLCRAASLPHGDEQVAICLLVPVLDLAAGHLVMGKKGREELVSLCSRRNMRLTEPGCVDRVDDEKEIR